MKFLKKTWLLWLLTALYIGNGFYYNNFYVDLIQKRQAKAKQNGKMLQVALVQSGTVPNGFETGVELAQQDLEQNSSVELRVRNLKPGQVSSVLNRDFDISAIVSDAPGKMASQLAVECESYGVGLLLINVEAPFVTSEGFRYVNKVEPGYTDYCSAVIDNLGAVCQKPEGEPIEIGLFFDRSGAGGDALVNTFLETTRAHDGNFLIFQQLSQAVQANLLKETDPISNIDSTIFLQTGIAKDGPGLSNYLEHFGSIEDESTPTTVGDALTGHPALKNPVSTIFTQAFDPSRINPNHLSVIAEGNRVEGTKADCVVLIAELSRAKPLIESLRTLGVEVPIICIDYEPAGWLESEFGDRTKGLYLVTSVPPDIETPRMLAFKERFRQQAQSAGRPVTEADEAAILAYESITMLAAVAEKQGSSLPIGLMTLLQIGGRSWPGLSAETIGFDSSGDGIGREITVIELRDGQYVSVKREEL
jgi:hypothetical protein